MSEEDIAELEAIDDKFSTRIKTIEEEIQKDTIVDEDHLDAELIRIVSCMQRWMTKTAEEKVMLNKIFRKRGQIHGDKYEKYKFKSNMKLSSISEVEEWINRDPTYQKIETYYNNQKVIVELYNNCIDLVKQKYWSIKSLVELRKAELGIK